MFPIHPFSTPRKQKTVRLSDVLRGLREGALGTNALIVIEWLSERIVRKKMDISQHFVWQLCVGLVEYSLFLRNLFSRRQKFDKDTRKMCNFFKGTNKNCTVGYICSTSVTKALESHSKFSNKLWKLKKWLQECSK